MLDIRPSSQCCPAPPAMSRDRNAVRPRLWTSTAHTAGHGAHACSVHHRACESTAPLRPQDTIVGVLDRTICSPIGALAVFGLLRRKPELFTVRTTRLARVLVGWVVFKTFHRALERLAANGGWKRDRPKWDRDVVLITGGAGGALSGLRPS